MQNFASTVPLEQNPPCEPPGGGYPYHAGASVFSEYHIPPIPVCTSSRAQRRWSQTRSTSLLEGVTRLTQVQAYFLNTVLDQIRYAQIPAPQKCRSKTRPTSLLEMVAHITQVQAYSLNTILPQKRYAESCECSGVGAKPAL